MSIQVYAYCSVVMSAVVTTLMGSCPSGCLNAQVQYSPKGVYV